MLDSLSKQVTDRYNGPSEGEDGWGGFRATLGDPVGTKFIKDWYSLQLGVVTEINQLTGNRITRVRAATLYMRALKWECSSLSAWSAGLNEQNGVY